MTRTNSLSESRDRYHTLTEPSSELPAKQVPEMFHLSRKTSQLEVSSYCGLLCYDICLWFAGSTIAGSNVYIRVTWGSSESMSDKNSLVIIRCTMIFLSEAQVAIMWKLDCMKSCGILERGFGLESQKPAEFCGT